MINKKQFISSLVLGISTTAILTTPALAKGSKMEKCYGIVKSSQNDCASKDKSHSCAAQSKKDSDKNEWIFLPKGTCERISGGELG